MLQNNRKTLMESREGTVVRTCGHKGVCYAAGHHRIIQGVACTHSAAEREFFFFFPTTSDTWFARGRARDQQH